MVQSLDVGANEDYLTRLIDTLEPKGLQVTVSLDSG
jgi:hypothetical protein